MSLYDGIDLDEQEGKKDFKPDVSGWGSRSKLLETQKQLQAKKASLINLKKKQNVSVAPVFDLKKRQDEGPLTFNMLTGKMERQALPAAAAVASSPTGIPVTVTPFLGTEAPGGSLLGVTDEYDALRPNDYETFTKKRKEQKQKEREEERKKELEERERRRKERHKENYSDDEEEEEHRNRKSWRREDSEDSEEEEEKKEQKNRDRDSENRSRGAAIAPPPSLIEDSIKPPEQSVEGPPGSGGDYGGAFSVGKGSVVSRMMAKMGYREGQGLGKSEQGMSTALSVEKTSKRGGKIIHERDRQTASALDQAPRAEVSNANLLKNPSKVLFLRNMVGPGEVDEDLEPETAEECQKYGKVNRCLIFEMPGVVEEEAVRIFVEFERQESAIKAVVDLNGRYFGGRAVKASFYNLDKFRRLELADPAE